MWISSILLATLALGSATGTEARAIQAAQKGATVASHAKGTFEVKVIPLPKDEKVPGLAVGRLSVDKQFHGDIEGSSKGEMMTAETSVEGSGAYVAVERVSGKLAGRSGSFTLVHQGTMRKGGDFNMVIAVVPDSGTEGLVGLAGKLTIVIADGKHSYDLEYTLPAVP